MARPKSVSSKTAFQIREMYFRDNFTQKQLSEYFQLSQSTICKIINNQIHKAHTDVAISGTADVEVKYNYVH